MSKSLRGHFELLLVLLTIKLSIESIAQQASMDKNHVQFPDDFLNFLKSLGIKSMKTKSSLPSTTPKMKHLWNKENTLNKQKAAFKDVLMMKLVSYYEDKYKVSHHKSMAVDNPVNKYDYTSKVNMYKRYDDSEYHKKPMDDYRRSNDPEDIHSDAEVLIL